MSRILSLVTAMAIALAVLPVMGAIADNPCDPLTGGDLPTFASDFVDISRAGGEPMIEALDDGTLLWGSHAGTTHVYAPAGASTNTGAFIENYQGQTYQYISDDGGVSWDFVPRLANPTTIIGGTAASGFSDPVFAVDEAGTIYISEINLANVAVSASTDGGRTYELRSLAAFTSSDRQWMSADTPGRLYMSANGVGAMTTVPSTSPGTSSGHVLALSTDGGLTWGRPERPNPNGVGETEVLRSNGDLYEITATGAGSNATLSMSVYRGIRDADSGFGQLREEHVIAEGVGYTAIGRQIDPTFDLDAEGNVYMVWAENGRGQGGRAEGIWYSYSPAYDEAAGGLNFSEPQHINTSDKTAIWPWITVGDVGEVAISYLENEQALPDYDAEAAGPDDGWNVMTAVSVNGLGCDESDLPGFAVVQASSEPVHYGTVCQGGTFCQTQAIDRRMGDYFSNVIDADGNIVIAVSDTTQGGAISLPRVIRQTGGHEFGYPNLNPAPAAD